MESFLTKKERKDLRRQHRMERERRYADRIKALLLWDEGWSFEDISHALLLDESTIRRYRQWYEEEGMERLLNDDWGGSESRLSEEQELELAEDLDEHLFHTTSEVVEYVLEHFGVEYSLRGMQHVLSRLGFVYKKTKQVPGKADERKQKEFVKQYENLKAEKDEDDPIYFVDGVHPLHNSPNLNPIERLWKFFKKKVLANRYYESYLDFQEACRMFFKNISQYKSELQSLLTDNFQIIRPTF